MGTLVQRTLRISDSVRHVVCGRAFEQEGAANVKTLRQSMPKLDMVYEMKTGVKTNLMFWFEQWY